MIEQQVPIFTTSDRPVSVRYLKKLPDLIDETPFWTPMVRNKTAISKIKKGKHFEEPVKGGMINETETSNVDKLPESALID